MPKPMTEYAAWMYLARRWDAAKKSTDYLSYIVKKRNRRYACVGLCCCLADMEIVGKISEFTHRRMYERMQKRRPPFVTGYWWPTHLRKGARARAAFCRRMAKLARKDAAQ